ncbi:LacI family DNA-binding transcriptional regulator [Gracilibacillus sp. YIM 98692]|uniref:LacI family DNA-binding transcriptional regulator n=1 Tax=Gracilibacillus sp. YIM 98692 TaxID=2663532 RepID=UPI0013D8225D|nr:LacI family DNA-binding transcriptional regulator [Gracilibacillus sp. YIM 98692]
MKVTAKMIAEELGMSTATVDRVLNNRKGVSDKTIQKVRDKAKELGYRPNRAAKFMSTQRLIHVAFILPVVPDYFWRELDKEIKKASYMYEDFGFHIEVHRVHTIPENEQLLYLENLIQEGKYDAIAIAPHDADPFVDLINQAVEADIPVFTVNTDVPNSNRIAYVGSNYFDAGYLAAELISLFKENLRSITLIRDSEDTYQMTHKERGFFAYFKEHNLDVEIQTLYFSQSAYTDRRHIKEVMEKETEQLKKTDAVYVASGILGEIENYWSSWSKKHIIIGHDINQEIYHAMKQGVVTATICQDPMAQATITLQKVTDYMLGDQKKKVKDHIVKLEIATPSNAKYYLDSSDY